MKWKMMMCALAMLFSAAAMANGKGCQLTGSWLGYAQDGTAWWTTTASGQNQSEGQVTLDVPGFNPTVYGQFPDAVFQSKLRGVWKRTGGDTFAYTVIGFATDADGIAQWIGKLVGTETLMDQCNITYIQNTQLWIYAPDADPYTDDPVFPPIDMPDHYGYRIILDAP